MKYKILLDVCGLAEFGQKKPTRANFTHFGIVKFNPTVFG